jgi:hypothetical protein
MPAPSFFICCDMAASLDLLKVLFLANFDFCSPSMFKVEGSGLGSPSILLFTSLVTSARIFFIEET